MRARTTKTLACLCLLAALAHPAGAAQPNALKGDDGAHGFDPLIGRWKATLKRLVHPLSGSKEWIEFEGTQITTSLWGGRGTMDEFHVHDAKKGTDVDGLTVRLYNAETRQWSIYWANAKNGRFDLPATVGRWTNGRG